MPIKTLLFILTILFSSLSHCQKIMRITKYKVIGNDSVKVSIEEFNNQGLEIKKVRFRKGAFNLVTTTYKNGLKVSKLNCDYMDGDKNCVLNSFISFEFDSKTGKEKETLYIKDSLIWSIKEHVRKKKTNYN